MDIKIDHSLSIPLGIQIREQIKLQIILGSLKEGVRLPSITKLSAELGVNKNTIVTIFNDLEKDSYIKGIRGKGFFVCRKNINKSYDNALIDRIDLLVSEAKNKKLDLNELINLVSVRYNYVFTAQNRHVLFISGISQEIVDVNLQKLKQNIQGAEFEGILLYKGKKIEELKQAIKKADLIVIPSVFYSLIKAYTPGDKVLIKTEPNFKSLNILKKGIEKKSKTAVIGYNQRSSELLASMFIGAGIFRPKLVLTLGDLEKYKKELKEIDTYVICISAREAVEKLKLKDKEVYFFSDYIDNDSIIEIKQALRKLR